MLGQFDPAEGAKFGYDGEPSGFIAVLFTLFGFVYWAFWIWMAVECYRRDPDWSFWMWIIVFVPGGPFIYFVIRFVMTRQFRVPGKLQRWTRGKEVARLEATARQIGNPYQYVQLGDVLRDVGRHDEAGDAYRRALQKEPQNTQALWGAGLVEFRQKQFKTAKERFEQILNIDPQYKFGDVSLYYAKALRELGENDAAREHLAKHIRRWRQPEGLYMLAQICAEQGDTEQARAHVDAMQLDIAGSPRAIARRQGFWKSRGQKLLKRLGG